MYDLLNPKNKNLTRAKKEKNDEFYTQLTDIEKELSHYDPEIFRDKVIYCPTDVATDQGKILQSQFVHYFQLKKDDLKFKKLIATCLAEKGEEFNNKYILVRKLSPYADPSSPYYNPNLTEDDDRYWSWGESTSECKADSNYGSGDFRSEECLQLFDEADIVITNPPFSLFRDFISILMRHNVDFMVIGNKNAITTKEVFPLLRDDKVWLGVTAPKDFIKTDGDKQTFGNIGWFTNITNGRRNAPLDLLPKEHWENQGVEFEKFDNYNAINVGKCKQIPSDYTGVMGVPISYFDSYCPDQFSIIGLQAGNAKGVNTEEALNIVGYTPMPGDKGGAGLINGRLKYARVLISRCVVDSIALKDFVITPSDDVHSSKGVYLKEKALSYSDGIGRLFRAISGGISSNYFTVDLADFQQDIERYISSDTWDERMVLLRRRASVSPIEKQVLTLAWYKVRIVNGKLVFKFDKHASINEVLESPHKPGTLFKDTFSQDEIERLLRCGR